MKVLFVCRANSGRSQIAMELYNHLYPGEAHSAGTHVDKPGQTLKERPTAASAIAAMAEIGIDMKNNKRRQLTPEMLDEYDHVIVLAEKKSIPGYLNTWPGAEMWHIEDTRVQGPARAAVIRNHIFSRVKDLGRRLH
jgi:protein-tyrosine-phosphatase